MARFFKRNVIMNKDRQVGYASGYMTKRAIKINTAGSGLAANVENPRGGSEDYEGWRKNIEGSLYQNTLGLIPGLGTDTSKGSWRNKLRENKKLQGTAGTEPIPQYNAYSKAVRAGEALRPVTTGRADKTRASRLSAGTAAAKKNRLAEIKQGHNAWRRNKGYGPMVGPDTRNVVEKYEDRTKREGENRTAYRAKIDKRMGSGRNPSTRSSGRTGVPVAGVTPGVTVKPVGGYSRGVKTGWRAIEEMRKRRAGPVTPVQTGGGGLTPRPASARQNVMGGKPPVARAAAPAAPARTKAPLTVNQRFRGVQRHMNRMDPAKAREFALALQGARGDRKWSGEDEGYINSVRKGNKNSRGNIKKYLANFRRDPNFKINA